MGWKLRHARHSLRVLLTASPAVIQKCCRTTTPISTMSVPQWLSSSWKAQMIAHANICRQFRIFGWRTSYGRFAQLRRPSSLNNFSPSKKGVRSCNDAVGQIAFPRSSMLISSGLVSLWHRRTRLRYSFSNLMRVDTSPGAIHTVFRWNDTIVSASTSLKWARAPRITALSKVHGVHGRLWPGFDSHDIIRVVLPTTKLVSSGYPIDSVSQNLLCLILILI
jgi:hypothetical protein